MSGKIAETRVPEKIFGLYVPQTENRQSSYKRSFDKVHASTVAKKEGKIKKRNTKEKML